VPGPAERGLSRSRNTDQKSGSKPVTEMALRLIQYRAWQFRQRNGNGRSFANEVSNRSQVLR
jgi:hypothetical protein